MSETIKPIALKTGSLTRFVKGEIFPILLVNFIGSLGYGVILPFLAFLVIDFGGNEVLYGLIAATYPLFQMFGAPLLGRWSDAIGRKKVLFISQAGTLLSWLIFLSAFLFPTDILFEIESEQFGGVTLTTPLIIILFARSLDGLTGGNISVANAYLSDVTPEKDRKRNFGKMASSMSLGFIIGPAIAGLFSTLANGNLMTIILTALISILGLICIHFFLPNTELKKEVYPCPEAKNKKTFGVEYKECYDLSDEKKYSWRDIITQKGVPIMILLFFLIFLAYNLFYATFSMHASGNLGWSGSRVGAFFTLFSGIMIIGQGPVLNRLSKKFSERSLFIAGAFTMVLTFSCLTSKIDFLLYTGAVLFGLGNGVMWPSFLSMLSKTGASSKQGSLQGIANGFGSMASILGLISGGFLLSLFSESIYFISAGIIIIIAIIGISIARSNLGGVKK